MMFRAEMWQAKFAHFRVEPCVVVRAGTPLDRVAELAAAGLRDVLRHDPPERPLGLESLAFRGVVHIDAAAAFEEVAA